MILTFEVDTDLGLKMEAVAAVRGCSFREALHHALENEVLGWEDAPGFALALDAAKVTRACTQSPKVLSLSSRLDPVPRV